MPRRRTARNSQSRGTEPESGGSQADSAYVQNALLGLEMAEYHVTRKNCAASRFYRNAWRRLAFQLWSRIPLLESRQSILDAAYRLHPERFVGQRPSPHPCPKRSG
jgi:hypothetical protein